MALSYGDAGVDIASGDEVVDRIAGFAKKTHRRGVVAGIGGFGALFSLKELGKYEDPILVSGCDGVGTKLKLAFMAGEHKSVGIDLVAMSVNDVLCHGAEPLFFLDYFATGALDVAQTVDVVAGVAEGCSRAGCALVGGETAELPGFYAKGEYDLAGFAVGIVERAELLPRSDVAVGDIVLGLASSGLHSNGYSLARKVVFDVLGLGLDDPLPMNAGTARKVLLEPTRIYVKPVLELRKTVPVKAIAHITGGGLVDNVPRVLPHGTQLVVNPVAWPVPKIFTIIQGGGEIVASEMYRTFNMGIGLIVVVAPADAARASAELERLGEKVYELGHIEAHQGEARCTIEGVE